MVFYIVMISEQALKHYDLNDKDCISYLTAVVLSLCPLCFS